MSRILVVDDREMMRDSVATTLSRKGHAVIAASSGKSALAKITEKSPDVIVSDLQMPEMTGLELLSEIRRIDDQIPVILMTAYGTIETAVSAIKQGAFDYITKPFSGDELLVAVERAIEHAQLVKENQILRAAGTPGGSRQAEATHTLIGTGSTMSALKDQLRRVADSHGTVLISGESGSGKEVAARWVHAHSPRAGAPFLALNCAAISTSLLESELFGHEKGAFTGADKLRKGRFELADGGTLLLDEISEIAPEIQAKLLRVLQERSFERVGSSISKSVDVRVIATTNRDLPAEVARGRFREDLYFRLNVLPLTMPPLRQHADDIESLAGHFLEQVARREGKPAKSIEPEALDLIIRYQWPGNVRELQNICERASVLTDGSVITAALIAPWLSGRTAMATATSMTISPAVTVNNGMQASSVTELKMPLSAVPPLVCNGALTLETIEREAIVATLHAFKGHRQKSAEALGIGVRTLGLKLKKWKEQQLVEPTL